MGLRFVTRDRGICFDILPCALLDLTVSNRASPADW